MADVLFIPLKFSASVFVQEEVWSTGFVSLRYVHPRCEFKGEDGSIKKKVLRI